MPLATLRQVLDEAAKGGYGFATDVFKIDYLDGALVATRAGYGQKVNIEVDFPGKDIVMLAIRGNVFKPPEGTASVPVTLPGFPPSATLPARSPVPQRRRGCGPPRFLPAKSTWPGPTHPATPVS